MAPQSQVVVSILTGIISSIIGYIQLNIAMLSYQADYERMRANLARLLSKPVGFRLELDEQMLGAWCGFVNQIVFSEEWRENFRIGRVFLYIVNTKYRC